MRKLASIQRISALLPIEGADLIEQAQVQGWNLIVKKGEFQVGDLAVYFEIDSFLPAEEPAFKFLETKFHSWNGRQGHRLKTMKMRGVISQGLVLPVVAFKALRELPDSALTEGEDLTAILKIEKWEAPEESASIAGGAANRSRDKPWPFFLQKTDQERVQNYVAQVQRASELGEDFEVTIKLDGSSMTVYKLMPDSPFYAEAVAIREKRNPLTLKQKAVRWLKRLVGKEQPQPIYGVCSRNVDLDVNGDTTFAKYVREHDLFERIAGNVEGSVAFQGELIAPSIQGNYEKVQKPEWYVYDVYDIDSQSYMLPYSARLETALAGFEYVPIVSQDFKLWQDGESKVGRDIVDKILAAAEGPGMNAGVKREGLVFKSNTTPLSFKAISNSYLLKKG